MMSSTTRSRNNKRSRSSMTSTDDDDDSDDDFVQQYAGRSVFAKRPKVETPNLTQSSVETEPSPPLSLEAIEEQAQKILQGMQFPIVQRIQTLQDIGWRKASWKRRAVIYPCIRLPHDEARLLFPKLVESKLPIRYLGWRWKDATSWEQVVPSTFYPLVAAGEKEEKTSGSDKDNQQQRQQDEDYLQQFLDQECGTEPSVARRVEELVIRGCWSKVQENQQKNQDKQRQDQEILEKLKAIPKSQSSQKEDTSSLSSTKHPTGAGNTDKDDNEAENDVDDDNDGMDSLLSPDCKRKRVLLRPGDIVEYYLPGRVFGNPDVLCQSKILGINPKGTFPLNLESGDFLDPDQKLRRLAKVYKGKLIPDTEGVFRAVREFSLRTAGTQELVGFHNKVRQITQSKQDFTQSMDEFWQPKETTESQTEEGPSKNTNAQKSEAKATISPIQTSNDDEAALPKGNRQCPTYSNLLRQLKQVENDGKTKRRYVPHITADEFRLILQAWSLLQQRLGPEMREEQAIETWVEELDISEMRIRAILSGDPQRKLSELNKSEILKELQQWITKTEGAKI